jgi:hypothetical protein
MEVGFSAKGGSSIAARYLSSVSGSGKCGSTTTAGSSNGSTAKKTPGRLSVGGSNGSSAKTPNPNQEDDDGLAPEASAASPKKRPVSMPRASAASSAGIAGAAGPSSPLRSTSIDGAALVAAAAKEKKEAGEEDEDANNDDGDTVLSGVSQMLAVLKSHIHKAKQQK